MADVVYMLCLMTSALCAAMLLRSYARSRTRLLLWSSLCFVGLAINNALLAADLVVLPEVDLALWRGWTAFLSVAVLLFGLVWDSR